MIKRNVAKILDEISQIFQTINEKEVSSLKGEILKAKNIMVIGSGRMGYAARGFTMRLGHLGFQSFTLGDTNLPSFNKKDLLIVCSGSGETPSIYHYVQSAKKSKLKICLITSNPKSKMGLISDIIVRIDAPNKTEPLKRSIQPMTTLNEQCLVVFFDALVIDLMKELGVTSEKMWKRHFNLE
jgi:6-phospho-3-hexuloisomerase